MQMRKGISPFWACVLWVAVCETTGIISGWISGSQPDTWYAALRKPSFNPPPSVFGPVWTLLYFLMGIAAGIVHTRVSYGRAKVRALGMFIIQLFLNFLWSVFFFGLHMPGLALADILLLLITIWITIRRFGGISKTAAWLMVPYLLWVAFATVLNFSIWRMN